MEGMHGLDGQPNYRVVTAVNEQRAFFGLPSPDDMHPGMIPERMSQAYETGVIQESDFVAGLTAHLSAEYSGREIIPPLNVHEDVARHERRRLLARKAVTMYLDEA